MRLLSPGDYGLMAMATVVIGLVGLISEMGFGNAIVQTKEIDTYQQRCIFGAALLINSSLGAILAISAPAIAVFFSETNLEKLIPLLALQFPLIALTTLPIAIAKRRMEFKELSIVEMISSLISAIVTLISALNEFGVWSLVFGQLAQAVTTPIILLGKYGTLTPALGYKGVERLIAFGTTITINRILWYTYSQADIFIAGKLLGKDALGAYSIAVTLATLPMQKISSIVNQIAFSSFARIQNDKLAISTAAIQSLKMMAFVSIPLLWGIASIARELTPVVLGEQWAVAALPLQIIAFITPLRMISALISTMTVGIGKSMNDLGNTFILAAISIPLFIIGTYIAGLNGLAFAWVIAYPICFLIILKRTLPLLQISLITFIHSIQKPILAGICMVATINLVRYNLKIESSKLLAAEILTGAIVFITISVILDKSIYFKAIKALNKKQTHT